MPSPLVLVTGATDGIGRQTALDLALAGATVLVHGRSPARVTAVCEALAKAGAPQPAHEAVADLNSLASVRALGASLRERFARLDAVVHNAGVFQRECTLNADGYEQTFAVNHLAPVLLTHLLLPSLEAARGRVVLVSSNVHRQARWDWDNLQGESHYEGYDAYARSKLGNVLYAMDLARRLAPAGVTANALHPGVVTTKLLTGGFGMRGPDSLAESAATSVHLALSPELAGKTGGYYARSRLASANPLARDEALCARVYEHAARAVGVAG